MVYGLLRALPGVPGFLATIACAPCRAERPTSLIRKLDSSIGEPESHDLTVRLGAHRLRASVSIAARTTNRDDRETPLLRAGARIKAQVTFFRNNRFLRQSNATGNFCMTRMQPGCRSCRIGNASTVVPVRSS